MFRFLIFSFIVMDQLLTADSFTMLPPSTTTSSSFRKMPREPSLYNFERKQFPRKLSMDDNAISAAFNIATFGPQPLWLLMTVAPNTKITKSIMGSWGTVIFFSLVHLFIVIASILQQDGTAPIAEFSKVFDPSGDPLKGMMGMMQYKNFVSEEWSHVLTWDLVVGRWIWLDGVERGIFTAHSVLFTNFLGPAGFLLHALTCIILRKSLPPPSWSSSSASKSLDEEESVPASTPAALSAEAVIREYFPTIMSSAGCARLVAELCDEGTVWEDTNERQASVGSEAVLRLLSKRAAAFPSSASRIVDVVTDDPKSLSSGYSWYLSDAQGRRGLRGLTFVELGANGKLAYVREVSEPLSKPGAAVAKLLKAVVERAVEKDPSLAVRPPAPARRIPTSAEDMVRYLWQEVNGSDKGLVLEVFSEDIVYNDFNYPAPFVGKEAVSAFISEFDVPGIRFQVERVSGGRTACAFTWRVQLAGAQETVKGASFYRIDCAGKDCKVVSVCDIAEPLIKPAPLQELAGLLRPSLRRFQPLP